MKFKLTILTLLFCWPAIFFASLKNTISSLHIISFWRKSRLNEGASQYSSKNTEQLFINLKDQGIRLLFLKKRKPNTDIEAYAMRVKGQIDSLSQREFL